MNPSSVTTTEIKTCLSDTELALPMHCAQQEQHCAQQEFCAVDRSADEHPIAYHSNLDLEHGPARGSRFRWISLAAVSAAVTIAIAPLAVGAWQRSHKVHLERQITTTASLANASETQDLAAKTESSTLTPTDSESPCLPPPDYVALREPTEDGERVRIVVLEPTRDIFIHESNSDGIQVRVRRYLFGTSTEQMVSAVDVQDLKEQSSEAFEIYQSHIGKAHFVGPAVSIYPGDEFVGMQPSGFLTAMPLDSAKENSEKSSSAKKKTKENMKAPPKKNGASKNTSEKSKAPKDNAAKNGDKKDAKPKNSTAKNMKSTKIPRATNSKNPMSKKTTGDNTKPASTASKTKTTSNSDSSSKKNKLTSQKTTGKNQETSKNQGKPTTKTAAKKVTSPNKAAKSDKPAQGKPEKSPKGTAIKQPKSTESQSAKSKDNPKNSSQKSMKNRESNTKDESSSKSSRPKVEATKKSAAQRSEDASSEMFQLAAELNKTHPNRHY